MSSWGGLVELMASTLAQVVGGGTRPRKWELGPLQSTKDEEIGGLAVWRVVQRPLTRHEQREGVPSRKG